MQENLNLKKGQKAAKYSTFINLILALIKGVVGILSGSVALIADSIHSFSDIFSSLAVYVGLKLSQKQPNQKFPYGYYKVESIVSLIISLLIIITGFEIAFESFSDFLNPSTIQFPILSLLTALISGLVSYFLARYKVNIGEEIDSQSLINDGKHSLMDVFSSLIVFAGIFASYIGLIGFQGLSGVLISVLIIYVGLKLGRDDILVLLDSGINPDKFEIIKEVALGIKSVEGVSDIKIRKSGPYIFAELHLKLKRGESVKHASEISKELEIKLKNKIPVLRGLMVQIDPLNNEYKIIAVPIKNNNGLCSELNTHFGKSPYFIIVTVKNGVILYFKIIENSAMHNERKKGINTAKLLKNENIDILVIDNLSDGPKAVFADYLIKTTKSKGDALEEIIINASK